MLQPAPVPVMLIRRDLSAAHLAPEAKEHFAVLDESEVMRSAAVSEAREIEATLAFKLDDVTAVEPHGQAPTRKTSLLSGALRLRSSCIGTSSRKQTRRRA